MEGEVLQVLGRERKGGKGEALKGSREKRAGKKVSEEVEYIDKKWTKGRKGSRWK